MCKFSFRFIRLIACTLALAFMQQCLPDVEVVASDPGKLEFFESKIRPVLIEHCYECHNSAKTHEGNLRLDQRDGIRRGGESGPSVVPNAPEKSLLLQAITQSNPDLKMPPSGVKLSDDVIEDFRRWIAAGAIDPRDKPPTVEEIAESKSWEKVLESRKSWWCFQPIQAPELPAPQSNQSPIDQLIDVRLKSVGLKAEQRASSDGLIRRLYFNLIGLPPRADEFSSCKQRLDRCSNDVEFQQALGELVDTLLADKRFGERWARHWMDWIRYAESHGSEGDPPITNAWMYRDYLIRSLNSDIPLDQMIREHIAGDLIQPRINPALGLNESLIATAHWRMVFHGFSPTDALDERVRFIDDQINAFSKAFLGVTLSCARCHDHKFEPISQQDYYALYGVLSSCRPGRRPAESEEVLHKHRDELANIKGELRALFAKVWQDSLGELPERIRTSWEATKARPAEKRSALENQFWQPLLASTGAVEQPGLLRGVGHGKWQAEASYYWDLEQPATLAKWYRTGIGLERSAISGEPIVATTGEGVLEELHTEGVTSRAISNKDSARLSSPDFVCPKDSSLWVLAEGDGGASLRYVVQNYPRNGTIYPTQPLRPGLQWHKFDIGYWSGDLMHVEVTAARDAPLLTGENARSWFRVCKACVLPRDISPPAPQWNVGQLLYDSLDNNAVKWRDLPEPQLLEWYCRRLGKAVERWADGTAKQADVQLLNNGIKLGLIPNELANSTQSIKSLAEQYRQVEAQIIVSNRIPCLEETVGSDAALYLRGDHRRPENIVPRRFLEAIDSTPFQTSASGRLQLADKVLANNNPLTRRVMVNRIWHHLFGAGIVPTPDNFGRLGALPSNQELLDWLATRLTEEKWSLKAMIRMMVLSQAWQRSSIASTESLELDPDNQLLSHCNVRRYEAESLRDSILSVAGNLDEASYGAPVANASDRKSIYLAVIRNSLNPLLRTFDFPEPFSTVGRRDQTNVPAQSLTLMNDPFLLRQSQIWAESTIRQTGDLDTQLASMIQSGFSRSASASEIESLRKLYQDSFKRIEAVASDYAQTRKQVQELDSSIAARQSEIRNRLLIAKRGSSQAASSNKATDDEGRVRPYLQWRFDSAATIENANLPGGLKLVGDSKIEGGALLLGKDSYAISNPLKKTLREKTLAALVQLDDLKQRGGGVISLQSSDGSIFDSIVFAEQNPKQWLAGSNVFARTKSFEGPAELTANSQPVHVAIVYQADGIILAYRDGVPYGTPYRSVGLQEFVMDNSVVTLGLRHLPAGGNRFLSGRIFRAQLYDRALSAEEIQAIASDSTFISQQEILAAMSEQQLQVWTDWQQQLLDARSRLELLQSKLPVKPQAQFEFTEKEAAMLSLAQVARTIFTLKEFIYVP